MPFHYEQFVYALIKLCCGYH